MGRYSAVAAPRMIAPARGPPRTFFSGRQHIVRCDLCLGMTRKKTLKDFTGDDLLVSWPLASLNNTTDPA